MDDSFFFSDPNTDHVGFLDDHEVEALLAEDAEGDDDDQ